MSIRFTFCLAILLGTGISIGAEQPKPRVRPDRGKLVIEMPTKLLVSSTLSTNRRAPKGHIDVPIKRIVQGTKTVQAVRPAPIVSPTPKRLIEAPTKNIIKVAVPAPASKPVTAKRKTSRNVASAVSDNPPIEPGKVRWHADYQAAITSSKKSGKPVLLFQLLGQLDLTFT